jgi:adenosine deaminase
MEHDFLPGDSLWARPDNFAAPVSACRSQTLGTDDPSPDCKAFLASSEKAAAQWELERRFMAFEARFQGAGFDRLLPRQ